MVGAQNVTVASTVFQKLHQWQFAGGVAHGDMPLRLGIHMFGKDYVYIRPLGTKRIPFF
jgi:hypothetical protein